MNVGSLFSGIGGIEHGLERAGGFNTIWFVENNKYCQAVLRKHWPSATIYDDITQVNWAEVPKVDVLTGGFPCQDISNAGKRKGITGERSGLWKEFAKAISVLRPRVVFIENVSALINRGLNVVLRDLATLGYNAEWSCLPARSVGAPHKRDRVFIIAYTNCKWSDWKQCATSVAETRGGRTMAESDIPNTHRSRFKEYLQSKEGRLTFKSNTDVAYAEFVRPSERSAQGTDSRGQRAVCSLGLQGREVGRNFAKRSIRDEKERLQEFRNTIGRTQWETEPNVDRMVNGVSKGLDNHIWRERIKSLGNAVVPQCAQFFAERIKEVAK